MTFGFGKVKANCWGIQRGIASREREREKNKSAV